MSQETPEQKAEREKAEKAAAEKAAAAKAKPKLDPDAPRGKNESREDYNERTGKGPSAAQMANSK